MVSNQSSRPLQPVPRRRRGRGGLSLRRSMNELRRSGVVDGKIRTVTNAQYGRLLQLIVEQAHDAALAGWPTPLDATKRLVGAVVVLLNITLLFTPVPLSNVVPALVIALISLAYLEEDGLLLSIALLASVIVLAVEFAAVWETILGAKWIFGLW